MIATPFDNIVYAPDWRWQAARHLSHPASPMKLNRAAIKDTWVVSAVKYLRATGKQSRLSEEDLAHWRRAIQLAEAESLINIRHTLEALLLTEAPWEALAADTGLPAEEVRLFELLFFNVRGDDGQMKLRPMQRQHFATEGALKTQRRLPTHLVWRRIAVEVGYAGLVRVLQLGSGSWSEARSVDLVQAAVDMGRADVMAQMAAGELSAAAIDRMEFNRIRDKQLRHMIGEDAGETEARQTLLRILQAMAPKMVEFQKLRQAQEDEPMQNLPRLEAQIQETQIVDHGYEAGAKAISAAVRNKLAPVGEKMTAAHAEMKRREEEFAKQLSPGPHEE